MMHVVHHLLLLFRFKLRRQHPQRSRHCLHHGQQNKNHANYAGYFGEPARRAVLFRQAVAADFVVVSEVHATIGEGGVRPDEGALAHAMGRLNELRAADLLVTFGAEPGNDQLAKIVREKISVTVPDGKHIGPTRRSFAGGRCEGAPDAFSIGQTRADEVAAIAAGVEMAVGQKRGVMHATSAPPCVAAPGDLGGLAVRRHLDAGRDAVEAHDEQPVARRHRVADGHAEGGPQRHAPIHLAGLRVQRLHRVAVPDDQLP